MVAGELLLYFSEDFFDISGYHDPFFYLREADAFVPF